MKGHILNNYQKSTNVLKSISGVTFGLVGLTIVSGEILASNPVSADDVVDNVSVTVPTSCTMSGTGMNTHTAEIPNGIYQPDIGTTTINTLCNDNDGFSIYAIGFTNNEYGNTNLEGTSASSNATIATGTATSGDTSNWAMKLATNTQATYPLTLTTGYDAFHAVPNEYTKVATRLTGTDIGQNAEGSTMTTTYAAYISKTQPADTYSGKVKYTLVHPNDARQPEDPRYVANLDSGINTNIKMKKLANSTGIRDEADADQKITTIAKASALPPNFTPSEANTISLSTSAQPVYIFFDDSTGTMNYYTEANRIYMNSDISYMFYSFYALTNIDGLAHLDTSKVTNMSSMFSGSRVDVETGLIEGDPIVNVNALASWNTSSVTDMSSMFENSHKTLTNIDGIRNWNTSNVTNLSRILSGANINNIDALANWNISNATNLSGMLAYTNITNINGAINWNTDNVTSMNNMLAGTRLTNIDGAINWNTDNVTNMSWMLNYTRDLTNIDGAARWNTGSVTSMESMFSQAESLIDISGARNWNTSNVTNMRDIFSEINNNVDATVLNGWNVSSTTNTYRAFTCPEVQQPCWYNNTTCPSV